MTLDGADDRHLFGFMTIDCGQLAELNVAAARTKSETMRWYRITTAGRRAAFDGNWLVMGTDEDTIRAPRASSVETGILSVAQAKEGIRPFRHWQQTHLG